MTDVSIVRASVPAKTILICDQHPVTRRVLTEQLAARGSHLQVVSAVRDAAAVVEAFTADPSDVVLIGIRGGAPSGPRAVDSLLIQYPSAPVIVFGPAPDTILLVGSVRRGAQGFMVWDVNQPSAPQVPTRPWAPTVMQRPARTPQALTELEHRVLRGMSLGHTNHEIGRHLSLSEQVVKTRSRTVLVKLGARDRAHAVALGLRGGLLT